MGQRKAPSRGERGQLSFSICPDEALPPRLGCGSAKKQGCGKRRNPQVLLLRTC
ncbi:MAG: hypothetical protein QXN69_00710 [Candidatus Methanomethylicaceae archaeon]